MKSTQKNGRFAKIAKYALAITALSTSLAASAVTVAPYFFAWSFGSTSYKVTSLMDAHNKAGVNAMTLAFGISGGGCTLGGGLDSTLNNAAFKTDIKQFIAAGGKVILSFGGASGTYLEAACSDTQMTTLIANLLDTHKTYALDFDVEGGQLGNTALNTTRNKAIVALQNRYPALTVSFTLPVMPTGMPTSAVNLLKSSIAAGVKIRTVNLMVMDYGDGSVSSNTMGQLSINALTASQKQLKTLYPSLSDAAVWNLLGATAMIGQNDVAAEVFTQADATAVTNFAVQKNINLLSYWAMQRDQVGTGSLNDYSKKNKTDFEFFKLFAKQTGGTSSSSSSAASSSSSSSIPGGGTTITSSNGFVNSSIASKTGTFTATFDATPSISPANMTLAFSNGAQSAYTGLAAVVRFNTTSTIDARNGGAYAAATSIPFTAGATYHFRMVINVAARTYSAYVTPPGGTEKTIGSNYAFRSEQASITSINNFNADVNAAPGGSLRYTAPVIQ
ncbi:MAG: Chitinase [Rhodocyclales bacterium]|nr:Chitinase [Rhodocyclales bacterium]